MKTKLAQLLSLTILAILLPVLSPAEELVTPLTQPTQSNMPIKVTLLGAVNKAGTYTIEDHNLLYALAAAGGLTRIANDRQITLWHPKGDGTYTKFVINLSKALDENRLETLGVMSGDIILVTERML